MKGGEKVDEGNKKARLRRAQRMALANGAQGEAATVTYQDCLLYTSDAADE